MLAAGAHALLRRRRALVAARLGAGEHILELHHAGVCEHQRRIVKPARASSTPPAGGLARRKTPETHGERRLPSLPSQASRPLCVGTARPHKWVRWSRARRQAVALIRRIGEGGMGSVWLAEHSMLGWRAAIKVLHAEFSHAPRDRDALSQRGARRDADRRSRASSRSSTSDNTPTAARTS